MLAINMNSPSQMLHEIKEKFKSKRLSQNLTQEGLANKSGVSLGSLKRFEASGQISFESLLQLALVLDCLDDFTNIANQNKNNYKTMEDLMKTTPVKKRGRIK